MKPSVTVTLFFLVTMMSCPSNTVEKSGVDTAASLAVTVLETSAAGKKLEAVTTFKAVAATSVIELRPGKTFQTLTGFGGSFTEASAYLLHELGPENRQKIINAYFGESGANYSLTRTHINSCDFSLGNYSYAPVPGDTELDSFSVKEDEADLIPLIQAAMAASKDGFKIIASPWTAPPWMKDNGDWRGGKLRPEYYATWALFFSKYLAAYQARGINIWAVTVENEPLGNDNNWESMHYTPEEMTSFVQHHLGPKLAADGHQVKIFGYDQNRGAEMKDWIDSMYANEASAEYFAGTAVHWYASTYEHFGENLTYAHAAAPEKHLIQTEGCIDAEVPRWQDDHWYWSKEATDWGWDWAPEDQKHLHPKYVPVYRYARDMIGCMNNWVDGWIDWNLVLDRQGGPNWFKNWCVAPVIVDPLADEVYFTPLYYTMVHFSKYLRPGAQRIDFNHTDEALLVTAAKNPDGSIALIVLNQTEAEKTFRLVLDQQAKTISISPKALQTIIVNEA